jgi:hypothetical protein
MSGGFAMTLPRDWSPYLRPPWLAAYAAGFSAWLALCALGGWALLAIVAGVGCAAIARIGWWLHTWSDREAQRALRRYRGGDAPPREEEP